MSNEKTSQAAIEFIILVSFMLFVILSFFAITSSKVLEAREEGNKNTARDIAEFAYTEIDTARLVNDGYVRGLTVAHAGNGWDYSIGIVDNREMVVIYLEYEYVKFLPSNVTGNISKGYNILSKENGVISIKPTPVYTNDDPTSAMLSQFGLTAFNAAAAVDNSIASQSWHTDSSIAGAFLKIDLGLGSGKAYTKAKIYASTSGYAGNYNVQYSDDNSLWTNAATGFIPSASGWNEKSWNSAGSHRYWRFLLTNTPGGGSWLNELEMYT